MSLGAAVVLAVVTVAVVALCWRILGGGTGGQVTVKAGPVSFDFQTKLEQIATDVAEVNASVNGVAAGEPKLRQTVERLARVSDWQCQALSGLAAHVGAELPERPIDT